MGRGAVSVLVQFPRIVRPSCSLGHAFTRVQEHRPDLRRVRSPTSTSLGRDILRDPILNGAERTTERPKGGGDAHR